MKIWAFKVYIRPILEYASQVWSPNLLRDIDHVESVQRRYTKLLPGMYNLPYVQRLKILKLDTLELRRLKADLILTYQIIHGNLPIEIPFFEISSTTYTRGHRFKLVIPKFRLNYRKSFLEVGYLDNRTSNMLVGGKPKTVPLQPALSYLFYPAHA